MLLFCSRTILLVSHPVCVWLTFLASIPEDVTLKEADRQKEPAAQSPEAPIRARRGKDSLAGLQSAGEFSVDEETYCLTFIGNCGVMLRAGGPSSNYNLGTVMLGSRAE